MIFKTTIEIYESSEKFIYITENYREYIEEYSVEIDSPLYSLDRGRVFNIKLRFDNPIQYAEFICNLTQHFPQQHYEIY